MVTAVTLSINKYNSLAFVVLVVLRVISNILTKQLSIYYSIDYRSVNHATTCGKYFNSSIEKYNCSKDGELYFSGIKYDQISIKLQRKTPTAKGIPHRSILRFCEINDLGRNCRLTNKGLIKNCQCVSEVS